MNDDNEFIKVFLPGESPWVKFVRATSDNTFVGRIDNHLVNTENHGYKFGDEVEFCRKDYGDVQCWEPVGD